MWWFTNLQPIKICYGTVNEEIWSSIFDFFGHLAHKHHLRTLETHEEQHNLTTSSSLLTLSWTTSRRTPKTQCQQWRNRSPNVSSDFLPNRNDFFGTAMMTDGRRSPIWREEGLITRMIKPSSRRRWRSSLGPWHVVYVQTTLGGRMMQTNSHDTWFFLRLFKCVK